MLGLLNAYSFPISTQRCLTSTNTQGCGGLTSPQTVLQIEDEVCIFTFAHIYSLIFFRFIYIFNSFSKLIVYYLPNSLLDLGIKEEDKHNSCHGIVANLERKEIHKVI